MSRRINQAIDLIAFTVLIVAGLMIAAGVAEAQQPGSASARKVDRPAVAVEASPASATVAAADPVQRTTTLIRGPAVAAAY